MTVAEQLRQARESQNLTLQQVAEITKIRTDHLRALEQGDFRTFAAPVYIRGFVRTYSNVLKLNVPEIMATLESELRQDSRFSETLPLEPPRGLLDFIMLQLSKLDWKKSLIGVAIILVAVILCSAYLVIHHQRTNDPLKNLQPGIYHSTQHLSGETLPLPASPPPRH